MSERAPPGPRPPATRRADPGDPPRSVAVLERKIERAGPGVSYNQPSSDVNTE